MNYSDSVLKNFDNPRNVGAFERTDPQVGVGLVGTPAQGAVVRLHIKVDSQGIIQDARFKSYGDVATIAACSVLTEWVKGKTLKQADALEEMHIAELLALPPTKLQSVVQARKALQVAIADYLAKQATSATA